MSYDGPLTEQEKVLIDLRGYILFPAVFPAVLSAQEMEPLRTQCEALRRDPEQLPPLRSRLARWCGQRTDRPSRSDAGPI